MNASTDQEYADNVFKNLFALSEAEAVPENTKAAIRDHLVPLYVRGSTVAKEYQQRYMRAGRTVYLLSPLAVASVAVGTLLPETGRVAFLLELVLLVTILVIVRRAHHLRTHSRWIENRLIVERARHAMVLVACGIRPDAIDTSVSEGFADSVDDAVRLALEQSIEPADDDQTVQPLAAFVRAAWLTPQLVYHERIAARAQKRSRFLERAGIAVFVAAIIAAAAHLILLLNVGLHLPPATEKGLVFSALVLPAAGAAIGGYRAHREYAKLGRRSASMVARLQDLESRFSSVSTRADLHSLIREAERWLLHETQDWVLLMGSGRLEATG